MANPQRSYKKGSHIKKLLKCCSGKDSRLFSLNSCSNRNKNQVYLLLRTLRQVLPDDVRILADTALDMTSVKNSLCALNQEITNLQQNLHQLTQTPSKSHASLYTADGRGPERRDEDSDGIKALREGFERKREREVLGKEESSSELADLTKLWHDFVEDQITTDIVVAKT